MKERTVTVLCTTIAVLFIGYIEYEPIIAVCAFNTHKMLASTDHLFYEWVFANVPKGTKICFIGIWDGGHSTDYQILNVLWDPTYFDTVGDSKHKSPLDIYHEGYQYFAWNSYQCPIYLADPAHYPRECKFFKELFDNSEVVAEFSPRILEVPNYFHIIQQGPIFRMYKFVPKDKRLSEVSKQSTAAHAAQM